MITLDSGENNLTSAVIDTAAGYAYFGTSTSPGIIIKIDLSNCEYIDLPVLFYLIAHAQFAP